MGVMQESGGTPFFDFATLQRQLRSPEPMRDVDAMLPLFENVARASKAAETLAASLLGRSIVEHFNARKGDSDWHALATLAFSTSVPAKPQQLAGKAIEQCIERALPFIFDHPLLVEKTAERIRKLLQKFVERKGSVSSIIKRAVKYPTQQHVDCVRRIFCDLKPTATPDDFYDWGTILQVARGPHIPQIRRLIGEFAAMKVQSNAIAPMNLTNAIPKIVDNCSKLDRHKILFSLLEASAKTTELGVFVRFVAKTFGTDNGFIDGYDDSGHSNIVRAAIKYLHSQHDSKNQRHRQYAATNDEQSTSEYSQSIAVSERSGTNNRHGLTRNAGGSFVGTLKSWCWWALAGLTSVILALLFIFMLDFKGIPEFKDLLDFQKWRPTLRPLHRPTRYEWIGLLAFPLSAIFLGVMDRKVRCNTDPTRIQRSTWYLVAALLAMLAGTVCTLCTGFQWLQQ